MYGTEDWRMSPSPLLMALMLRGGYNYVSPKSTPKIGFIARLRALAKVHWGLNKPTV